MKYTILTLNIFTELLEKLHEEIYEGTEEVSMKACFMDIATSNSIGL
jgi:hypothetical protein